GLGGGFGWFRFVRLGLWGAGFRGGPRRGPAGFGRIAFGFLITLAAIIGDVKTGALENHPGPRANLALDRTFAPGLLPAEIFRTDFQRVVFHRLDKFKALFAFGAFVFVSWHSGDSTKSWACIQQRL